MVTIRVSAQLFFKKILYERKKIIYIYIYIWKKVKWKKLSDSARTRSGHGEESEKKEVKILSLTPKINSLNILISTRLMSHNTQDMMSYILYPKPNTQNQLVWGQSELEFQYLIPTYSWTLTPIPNWTCFVVIISHFQCTALSTWLINCADPSMRLDQQLEKDVSYKVLQFIQTMKIMKLLGHKTLRCTNTTTSSRTRAN